MKELNCSPAMLRAIAVEYVAQGHHDYAQIFTTPDCRVDRRNKNHLCIQVWVAISRDELSANPGLVLDAKEWADGT